MKTRVKGIAPLAIALLATSCFAQNPGQTPLPQNILTLNHSKAITVGEGPHGIAVAGGVVINANPKSGDISFIDPASEAEVKRLSLSGGKEVNSPTQAKATHDGQYALTMDSKAHLLRMIKGSSREVVDTVSLGKVPGSKPVWADDSTAYLAVGTGPDANVTKVSWPNGFEAAAATESLTVSRPGATLFTAGFVAVGGGYLAVPNGPDNSVSFVKLSEPSSVTTLQEGNNPGPIDIATADGKPVLIFGNKNSSTVVLYDLAAQQKLAVLQVGSTPTDMVLRGDGRFAYVTCAGSGEVAVIDVAERKLHGLVKVGRGLADKPSKPVHVFAVDKPAGSSAFRVSHSHEESHDPAAQQIWVGGDGDGSVTVLDAQTQQVMAVITVGVGHHKMAFTDTKAFVSNLTENSVSVIDRTAIR